MEPVGIAPGGCFNGRFCESSTYFFAPPISALELQS
jgi:hypothetical protein